MEPQRAPAVRRKAAGLLSRLSQEEREALLIKCWMSHDARWFMAAAMNFGMEAANRLNRAAVREQGKVEARRLARALELPPPQGVSDYLLAQEAMIGLLGPDLLEYAIALKGSDGFELAVERCFGFDNVTRAGVAAQYECGIIPRMLGWLDALAPGYEVSPQPGKCMKAEGGRCAYSFRLHAATPPAPSTGTSG